MATLSNAIKRAEKVTGTVARYDGSFYWFSYKGYWVSFARNGRGDDATNFYTRRHDVNDDHQTDYFAGTFHDNVTQAFRFVDRITEAK